MKIKDCACSKPYRRTSSLLGGARSPTPPGIFLSRMMRGPNGDGEPSILTIGCVHPAEVSGIGADHKLENRTPFTLRRDVEARGSMMIHEHESEPRDLPFLAHNSRLSDPIIFVKPWLGVKAELCNSPIVCLRIIVSDGPQLRNTAHQDTLPRSEGSPLVLAVVRIFLLSLVSRVTTWGRFDG